MDLNSKPLYALRDLATRLGVRAPTACTKTVLIQKIEERKKQLEDHAATSELNNLGRPRLNNCYIEIQEDENGKITFIDSDKPTTDGKYYDIDYYEILQAKLPPVIEDENTRKQLEKAKEILDLLSFAIKTCLEK